MCIHISKKGNRENWTALLDFLHLHGNQKGSVSSKLFYPTKQFKQEVKDNVETHMFAFHQGLSEVASNRCLPKSQRMEWVLTVRGSR